MSDRQEFPLSSPLKTTTTTTTLTSVDTSDQTAAAAAATPTSAALSEGHSPNGGENHSNNSIRQRSTNNNNSNPDSTSEPKAPSANAIRAYIAEAISIAHQAVSADKDNDYEKARALYREAAQRLEHVRHLVPIEHSQVLLKYSNIYIERATALKREKSKQMETLENIVQSPSHSSSSNNNNNNNSVVVFKEPVFPVQFVEVKIPESDKPEPPPASPLRRPYWFMRCLQRSMLYGGYLTPNLYIPKAVWAQSGAKLVATPAKIAFCESLADNLRHLSAVDFDDHATLSQELDKFLQRAEVLQDILAKAVPSTQTTTMMADKNKQAPNTFGKKVAWFGNAIAKGATGLIAQARKGAVTEQPYVPWLVNLFEQSQFLDVWLNKIESITMQAAIDSSPQQVMVSEQLERISTYFHVVVCSFVLTDLNILLERYMKKSRESFSRLFPKNYNHKF